MSREVAPPRELRIDIGDAELAVLEWAGQGHPILLVHATGFHGRCWNAVVRHLPGRHVYAADLRFHGASDASGEVSWGLMAEELHRLACDPLDEAAIYLSQRGNESIFGELPRIACPVTLLRAPPRPDGSTDLSASPTWPGLAAALPDCREVYLPDMNHFIPMQDPELVAKYIAAAP